MRVVQINLTARQGGTGRVCYGISQALTENNIENYTLFSSGNSQNPYEIKYTSDFRRKINALISKVLGNYGFNSHLMTKKLISHLKKLKPDIVHLHNLHAHNVNLKMLFSYFKKNPQIKLFWTFHDCWSFTGYCPHFDMVGCEKWKASCGECPQKKQYSWFFDKSKKLYKRKKELFTGLNLTIITPSKWLANIAKQTFFKDYEIKVINNGVDLNVFKLTESNFRESYKLQGKHIVLGVADGWNERKGLDVFISLSKCLSNDYQIVLVGTDDKIDELLPENIISIHKTHNAQELAKIYTASDVFVNCTREETFGLVNIEALACGTPVVTFNTGGCPECIDDSCGVVVAKNDIEEAKKEIVRICEQKIFSCEDCVIKSQEFEKYSKYRECIKLYIE